jgi:predicted ester cyclase
MSAANKALVHEYLERVWNGRDVEALDDFYPSPHLSEREDSAERQLPSLEDAKEYIRHVQAAFPDLQVVIDDIIAEEDKVAVRTTWRSSYQEKFRDVTPSASEQVEATGNLIWRIADGKIVEMKGTLGERTLEEIGLLEHLVSIGMVFFKFPPWRCRYN